MNTSFTALETFSTCPLKYKFKEIDRIKTLPSTTLAFGSLIHKTLKFIHGEEKYPSREDAIDFFSENWNPQVFGNEAENLFENGLTLVSNYLETLDKTEKKKRGVVIALEKYFILPLGAHTVSGSIDRIDKTEDGFEVIDYKTNRKVSTENEVKDSLQLGIYLKAFAKEWPSFFESEKEIEKVKLSLYFVRHNLKVSVTKTLRELELMEGDILKTIEEIEKRKKENNFEPRMSALCDWCDYQKHCPLFSHKYKPLSDAEKERKMKKASLKLIELKEKKSLLEKEIKSLNDQMMGYLKDANLGQFFTEKGSVSRILRETYAYNPKLVLNSLKDWKIDPASLVKIDSVKLKKIASKLSPEQRRELESFRKLERENDSLTVRKT